MGFAENLAKLRKQRGLTQMDLVKRTGVGIAQIRRYEGARSSPTLEVIAKLAKVLAVSADELIFDAGKGVASARILDRELLEQFEALSQVDAEDRDAVKRLIAAVIAKSQIERAMSGLPRKSAAVR